jgi:hypothetical protein
MMRQVMFMPPIGMIGVGVCNYGIVNGFPWVNVKFPFGAVNPFSGKLKKRFDNVNWF